MCDETNAITDAMQRVADATLMEVERLREADRQVGRDEERARIERIIEDERRTHRILDTRENGFVVAVLDNLIAAIRQEASDA